MLTHALCQAHVAFITPVLITTLRANKVMLHVQSVIITKHLSQQLESLLRSLGWIIGIIILYGHLAGFHK